MLPKVLLYPRLLNFRDIYKSIEKSMCYVIQHYGYDGLSVLLYRQPSKDQIIIICGDWHGISLDMQQQNDKVTSAIEFLNKYASRIVDMMKYIKLEQMQLFLTYDLVLVDAQVATNKFAGPGMIRDLFGRIINIQNTIKIEVLDDRSIDCILNGAGNYSGNIIIKPAKFRMYHEQSSDLFLPLYAEVTR